MSRPVKSGNHLFMPVTRSTTTPGHIDGIASQVCIFCHTVSGAGGLEDLINERKEEYHEAVEATIYVLDKLGFHFRPSNPYFFKPRNSNDVTTRVSVANGSTTVTASVGAPLWLTGTSVVFTLVTIPSSTFSPDYFKVNADGPYYRIEASTDTTLTLREPYEGPTVTDAEFTIIQGRSGGTIGWLTKVGKGVVPALVTDTDTTGNTTGRYNLGAAFNLNLLEHDPGGYAHNRIYSKRLLYDSIDWADDNLLNYSVGATLNTVVIDGIARPGRPALSSICCRTEYSASQRNVRNPQSGKGGCTYHGTHNELEDLDTGRDARLLLDRWVCGAQGDETDLPEQGV
jgi:hypothetical protein